MARPSRWGNPWRVVPDGAGFGVQGPGGAWTAHRALTRDDARAAVVELFRAFTAPGLDVRELAGWDLACWCPLTTDDGRPAPCHGDVLIDLANTPDTIMKES